jgi:DNA-binding NarL/FixJ family response regulator
MTDSTEQRPTIRVLITDDHPVMRHGLSSAVSQEAGLELVGEAVDGADAIAKFRELRPSVTLMDLQMPGVDGLQAIETIRKEFPEANIIVLTSYPGDVRIMRALTLGATSYLLKSATLEEIISAIRASVAGRHVIAPEAAHELAKHVGGEILTARELSVLRLVSAGQGNKAIAESLCVSEETIKSRMRSILGKLGALDRANAVMIAVQRGFLDP